MSFTYDFFDISDQLGDFFTMSFTSLMMDITNDTIVIIECVRSFSFSKANAPSAGLFI